MSADAPDEEVDLTAAQRQRIDDLFAQLDHIGDRTLLGVDEGADRAAIRRAYFERISEFHSDRYFRRALGSYKAKMDAVAHRMTLAYERLGAQERRPSAPSRQPGGAARSRPNAEQQQALAALKQQLEARHAEARRWLEESRRATRRGNLDGAVEAARQAVRLAPNDPEVLTAHDAAQKAASSAATDALRRQAEFEEKFGHWSEAATTWRRVVDARPDDAAARGRLELAIRRAHGESPAAPGRSRS